MIFGLAATYGQLYMPLPGLGETMPKKELIASCVEKGFTTLDGFCAATATGAGVKLTAATVEVGGTMLGADGGPAVPPLPVFATGRGKTSGGHTVEVNMRIVYSSPRSSSSRLDSEEGDHGRHFVGFFVAENLGNRRAETLDLVLDVGGIL